MIFTGQKIGFLLVLKRARNDRYGNNQWLCKCTCGALTVVAGSKLLSKHTRSCGCLRRELMREKQTVHGCSGVKESTEYRSWRAMRSRCLDAKNSFYANYGGRGIKICKRWQKFENFFADMGYKPSSKHTLDRINNDGNYTPNNCQWATQHQQARNRRGNRLLTINGKTQCLTTWLENLGIARSTYYARLRLGWSLSEALNYA